MRSLILKGNPCSVQLVLYSKAFMFTRHEALVPKLVVEIWLHGNNAKKRDQTWKEMHVFRSSDTFISTVSPLFV